MAKGITVGVAEDVAESSGIQLSASELLTARLSALDLAVRASCTDEERADTVARAEAFVAFLVG